MIFRLEIGCASAYSPQWIHAYLDCRLCPDRPNPKFCSAHPMAISNPLKRHAPYCQGSNRQLASKIRRALRTWACRLVLWSNCPSLVEPIGFLVAQFLVCRPESRTKIRLDDINSNEFTKNSAQQRTTFGGFWDSKKMLLILITSPAWANATSFRATNIPGLSRKPRPVGSERSHI